MDKIKENNISRTFHIFMGNKGDYYVAKMVETEDGEKRLLYYGDGKYPTTFVCKAIEVLDGIF